MLSIALKEWSIVCDLLIEGRLAIVLRKGGIHESSGPGVFELEHPRFVLFPTWLHQRPEMIKEEHRDRVVVFEEEPSEMTFHGVGEAATIWQVPSRRAFDELEDMHCWTKEQIDMRFNYKPDRPLYLMAIRAYALNEPVTIENHTEYSGCRSWVPLRPGDEIDDSNLIPAMSDQAFDALVERVNGVMK